jgi:hypothetical protein
VSASHEAGSRSIDFTAPNPAGDSSPNSGKSAQKKAAVPGDHALCKCILLVGLSIFQIGCREQSTNGFSFPENPTPLPDPSDQIDMSSVHRESGQLLERSDESE